MGRVDGKVTVITGAGRGLGRAQALLFAREGARVVVNDTGSERDGRGADAAVAAAVAQEIRDAGGEAIASSEDIAAEGGAQRLVEAAVAAYGRVDVLVLCAGNLRDRSLSKLALEDWQSVLDVHLTGSLLCLQAGARQMIAQGDGGRIVLMTSVSGMLGNFGQAGYGAAKAGVYGLMRTAAIELQKHRITVNAIAPKARTRMTEDLPMFRAGMSELTPEHVAPVALFLGSDLCGERTGHVLAVAGSQVFAFKVVQSGGKFKEGGVPWTPDELADHWDSIVRF